MTRELNLYLRYMILNKHLKSEESIKYLIIFVKLEIQGITSVQINLQSNSLWRYGPKPMINDRKLSTDFLRTTVF